MSVAINSSPAGALSQGGYNKRRASDDENELQADGKRSRYSWYFTLEQESPEPTSEDSESIYTAQEYETEFARDTSDTSTHTWVSDSDYERDIELVEYEVDSASDSNNLYNTLSSSSEPENIFAVELITFCDSEGMADDSDVSKCSTDCEPRVSAFKTCVQCKTPNNSMYQYCRKCFQERKTYFPRPRRKPRSSSKSSKTSDRTSTTTLSNSTTPTNSQELIEMDSGIGSSQAELDLVMSPAVNRKEMTEEIQHQENLLALYSRSSETSAALESSQASEVLFSQSSEAPMSESQISETAMSESQSSETPLTESQSSEMPLTESQSSDTTIFDSQSSELHSSQTSELPSSQTTELLSSQTSELLSSQSSTITLTSMAANLPASQESFDEVDSGVATKDEPSSSQDSVNSEKQDDPEGAEITIRTLLKRLQKLEKEGSASSMLCITCFENKRDSVFNHGKTGHQCCCYKCAKKVCMSNRNRCPMCNRRVSSITKIFLD